MIAGAVHRLAIDASPETVSTAARRALEDWGGTGEGAASELAITLPVVAGLRRGSVRARLAIAAEGAASEVVLRVEEARLEVNVGACAVLALAALGGIASVSWPWFPQLLPAVPLALVLAVGGWLLIASRLRSAGPEEFLEAIAAGAVPDTAEDSVA